MGPRSTRSWWIKLSALLVVLVLVAAACGGSDDEGAASDVTTAGASAESAGTDLSRDGAAAGEDALGSGGAVPVVAQATDIGRDIIFTAQITVAVTDVASAGAEATRIIESMGGFLFGQETRGAPEPVSILVFKVLPADFQEALTRLGEIGDLRNQTVSADDVTERVVDLQSRINTAEASVERLRALLDEAGDIATIAQIENQLLERETQLETLRGQLRTLRDAVDLATITLTLTEALANPQVSLATTAYLGHEDAGLSCPGDGGVSVDEGGDVTVCFEIRNVGDTSLTNFELRDPVLGVELDDLLVVFGDLEQPIEPGQSITLALETSLERDLRTQTTVRAVPLDDEGQPVERRTVANTTSIFLNAVDPGGVPTFMEGLESGWEVLINLFKVVILAAGVFLPFIWVPVLLWLFIRWRRQRRATHPPTPAPTPAAPAPVGDPAAPGPVGETAGEPAAPPAEAVPDA
jgi:hypothetical protein